MARCSIHQATQFWHHQLYKVQFTNYSAIGGFLTSLNHSPTPSNFKVRWFQAGNKRLSDLSQSKHVNNLSLTLHIVQLKCAIIFTI